MNVSKVFLSSFAILAVAAVASAAQPKTSMKGAKNTAKVPKGGILFDQTGSQSGNAFTSQDFEAAYDIFDNQGADDFMATGPGFSVDTVIAPGQLSSGVPNTNVNVQFFADAGGIPGAVICNYANIATVDDGIGNTTTTLTPPCAVPPGLHWVSVQARKDFLTAGQWFWAGSTSANNNPGKWQNPGGGFGTPCSTWGNLSSCIAGDNEWAFALMGVPLPVELQEFSIE